MAPVLDTSSNTRRRSGGIIDVTKEALAERWLGDEDFFGTGVGAALASAVVCAAPNFVLSQFPEVGCAAPASTPKLLSLP